jgi:DNA-binding NarL/FixJ family response regulator
LKNAAIHAAEGLDAARRAGLRSGIEDRAELIAPAIERLLANKHLNLDPATLAYWRAIVGGPESPADDESVRQRLRMRLSPRQAQVLELLARGLSSKEIANRLGLGVGTVKAHRISLYRKLGVTLRSEAVSAFERIQKRPV